MWAPLFFPRTTEHCHECKRGVDCRDCRRQDRGLARHLVSYAADNSTCRIRRVNDDSHLHSALQIWPAQDKQVTTQKQGPNPKHPERVVSHALTTVRRHKAANKKAWCQESEAAVDQPNDRQRAKRLKAIDTHRPRSFPVESLRLSPGKPQVNTCSWLTKDGCRIGVATSRGNICARGWRRLFCAQGAPHDSHSCPTALTSASHVSRHGADVHQVPRW